MDKLRPFHLIVLAIFGFAAILGLVLFANFGGVGGNAQALGRVVIWGTLPQATMESVLQSISANNDSYKEVSYVEVPAQNFASQLSDALASGTGPDLALMPLEQIYAERNKLQIIAFSSIPQRTFVDSYLPLFEILLTSEGTYGVPFLADPLVLYYNRSILSSSNIVNVPSVWEAVAGLAPTLSVRDSGGTISRSTIALGEYTNIENARAILSLLFLQSGTPITEMTAQGVRSALQGEKNFGSTPAESAVNFYTQFADPAKTVYSWNRSFGNSRQAFIAGDVAFYLGFASELSYIRSANPNLSFDIAQVPQPASATSRTTYGEGYVFVLPKQALNPQGAFIVANDFTTDQPMKTAANALFMAPAKKSLLSANANSTYEPIIYASALIARSWLSPSPVVTDGIFAGMIGNITSGRLDVSQALNAAQQSLDASIR